MAILIAPAAAAAWGLWPLRPLEVSRGESVAPARPSGETALAALDTDAFRAPLWVAPPAPPAPPAPAAPPAPLRLQLLAVVHEGAAYRAMLYDPDSDKLMVVGEGEKAGARTVEKVTASGVQIRDAAGVRALALRQDQGASP